MKKLIALFIITMLILASAPLFAQESEEKAHPWSPFNIVEGWFSSLGEKADGTPVWQFNVQKESTLTAEEVLERRERTGAGMRGRVGVK